jgi:hypothetical protein
MQQAGIVPDNNGAATVFLTEAAAPAGAAGGDEMARLSNRFNVDFSCNLTNHGSTCEGNSLNAQWRLTFLTPMRMRL